MLRLKSWQKIQKLLQYKIYTTAEKLKSVNKDEFESVQGELRGLEWFLNEIKFFENKIIKNNKQSPKT